MAVQDDFCRRVPARPSLARWRVPRAPSTAAASFRSRADPSSRHRGTALPLPCGCVRRAPQGPPLVSRFSRRDPASGASSLADARALGARPLVFCGGSLRRDPRRPRAARRLLQSNHSASTTVDDPNPAHRAGSLPPSQLYSRVATAVRRRFLSVASPPVANRDFTGQGSGLGVSAFIDPTPLLRDRSRRELCPAPLGSGTSCCSPRDEADWSFPAITWASLPSPAPRLPWRPRD